jgi:hypothetical protein
MLRAVTEPHVSLTVVRDEPDPYVIDGWDARAKVSGLSPRTLRAARAVAEALFSTHAGPPPAERLEYLTRDLADFYGHVTLRARLVFRACIATVSWIAPLLIGELKPLGRLPVPDRVRALERLEASPLSLALLGAKAILSLVYYEHPDAAREIGWDQRPKLGAGSKVPRG